MFRFLLTPRWIGLALFVIVMGSAFVWLGSWQYDRSVDRNDRNDAIEARVDQEPVAFEPPMAEWTSVHVEGQFDTEHEAIVRFRTRDGHPGVEVVTPLRTDDGIVLVNRGWLATEHTNASPENVPPAPAGTVQVTGWVQNDSGAKDSAVKPRDHQVRAIAAPAWEDFLGEQPVTGWIAATDPMAPGLKPAAEIDLGSGPHFFYAIQWYFFAALAVVGYFWFVRAELIEQRKTQPADATPS